MAHPSASRVSFAAFTLMLGGLLAGEASAQQALCTCCNQIFSPRGATWIGMDRRPIHGRCPDCILSCWDCVETAKEMRQLYNTLMAQRNEEGIRNTDQFYLDQRINELRNRWADLRFSCLLLEGKDIGRLDPSKSDNKPGKGMLNPDTKEDLRKQAQDLDKKHGQAFSGTNAIDSGIDMGDFAQAPEWMDQVMENMQKWQEAGRTYNLLNKLANDPPDKDYKTAPQVKLAEAPKADDKPKEIQLAIQSRVALKNSNDCLEAFITALERYQGAQVAKDKSAMKTQVKAMQKLAATAESEARKSAALAGELATLRLAAMEKHAEAGKWVEDFKSFQSQIKEAWPADFAKRVAAAGIPADQSEAFRKMLVDLKPDEAVKSRAETTARMKLDARIAKALAGAKDAPSWPAPPHTAPLALMRCHAETLHATVIKGKTLREPGADPFKEAQK